MVFLIQNTQNRDSHALHLKIDELILSKKGARDEVAGVEGKTEEELAALRRDAGPADGGVAAENAGSQPEPAPRS